MIATFILDRIVFDQAYLSCVSLTPGAIRSKLYEKIQSAAIRQRNSASHSAASHCTVTWYSPCVLAMPGTMLAVLTLTVLTLTVPLLLQACS